MKKKLSLILFIVLQTVFFHVWAENYRNIEDKSVLPILSPTFKDRKTAKIELENGLQVYLISDPQIEKSAAVLVVEAGSWEDPLEHQGMAHFLEHMLFLGTEKYPEEGSYERFLKSNNGFSNAFTRDLSTTFMFEVDTSAYPEAVDRFARFFKEPLLDASRAAREMRIIGQEFAEHQASDGMRLFFVQKELGNYNHPNSKFNIGNNDTLSDVSTAELKKFFTDNYSANLMKVVLYSSLPLEELKKIAVEDFSGIPNMHKQSPRFNRTIYGNALSGKIVHVEPLKEVPTLVLAWELPPHLARHPLTQPDVLIGYVIGDEGPNSLFAQLQKEQLADSIRAGAEKEGLEGLVFYIEVGLTKKGINNVDKVIERIFQAIANLREKGFPRYLFDDIQRLSTIQYQYPSRKDAFSEVMKYGQELFGEDISTYPQYKKIVQKFDPKLVQQFIEYLKPGNSRIFLLASQEDTGIKPEIKEKWMGVEYVVKDINPEAIVRWNQAKPDPTIDLPPANPFITQNLSLLNKNGERVNAYPIPEVIVDNNQGILYYAPDKYYQTPQVSWNIRIRTPQVDPGNAIQSVLTDIYILNVREKLNRVSYQAKMAGLDYYIDQSQDGILISISGYHDKIPQLFHEIVENLKPMPIALDLCRKYKDTLLRQYTKESKESVLLVGIDLLRSVLRKDYVKSEEKLKAIRKINNEHVNEFLKGLYRKTYLESVAYGNINKRKVTDLWQELLHSLPGGIYPKEERNEFKVALLSDRGPYYIEKPTEEEGSAVLLVIEKLGFSFKAQAANEILSQMIQVPFFNALRTQQRTAYIVSSSQEERERFLLNLFGVQSHTHDTRDILSRIELLIEEFLHDLVNESSYEDQFKTVKVTLQNQLKQLPNNMSDMGDILFKLAFNYDGDFKWFDKVLNGYHELTYPEFLEISQSILGRNNKRRMAVLVQGIIGGNQEFRYEKAKTPEWIREQIKYQSHKDLDGTNGER